MFLLRHTDSFISLYPPIFLKKSNSWSGASIFIQKKPYRIYYSFQVKLTLHQQTQQFEACLQQVQVNLMWPLTLTQETLQTREKSVAHLQTHPWATGKAPEEVHNLVAFWSLWSVLILSNKEWEDRDVFLDLNHHFSCLRKKNKIPECSDYYQLLGNAYGVSVPVMSWANTGLLRWSSFRILPLS